MEIMNSFVKRNMPVVIFGAITVLIFFVIIIVSQSIPKEESKLPTLKKVDDNTNRELDFYENQQNPQNPDVPVVQEDVLQQDSQLTTEQTLTFEEIEKIYGVLEISYTTGGFKPRNVTGYSGQMVRWTNFTEAPINIVQTTPTFDEWEGGKQLQPGEVLEFRLYKSKLWTYIEEETESFGSIFIRQSVAR